MTPNRRLERAIIDARDALLLHRTRPSPVDRAQAVLFLAELRDSQLVEIPTGEIEAEAAGLQRTGTVDAGVWAALARARAGLPIDPDLLAFLQSATLSDEHAGLLARTLAWLSRPEEARAHLGDGLHDDAARLRLDLPVDPARWRAEPVPAPDDPNRADWLVLAAEAFDPGQDEATVRVAGNPAHVLDVTDEASVRFLADGHVNVDAPGALILRSDRPHAPDTARGIRAVRRARAPHGVPAPIVNLEHEALQAGCNPCLIEVGDAVQLPPGVTVDPATGSSPLQAGPDGAWVSATPGTAVLRGLTTADGEAVTPLTVQVLHADDPDERTPLPASHRLMQARVAVAAGQAPDLPDPDVHSTLDGAITEVALTRALRAGDDEATVQQFQRLVAVQPSTALALSDVRSVALAMARTGRADQALRVWRAGLDAAFRAEATRLESLDPTLGGLRTAKLVYAAAHRYPEGPAVGDALALLPSKLWAEAEGLADEASVADGISALDVRLTAAAWDRELLALLPDHARAPSAGLRLARSLLTLGAPARAARWAALVSRRFPDHAVSDAALYLEALSRTESGEAGAQPLLRQLMESPFPQPDGTPGPSVHRSDAELVMGRLLEARGDYDAAREAYRAVAGEYPDAARSLAALEHRHIGMDEVILLVTAHAAEFARNRAAVNSPAARRSSRPK